MGLHTRRRARRARRAPALVALAILSSASACAVGVGDSTNPASPGNADSGELDSDSGGPISEAPPQGSSPDPTGGGDDASSATSDTGTPGDDDASVDTGFVSSDDAADRDAADGASHPVDAAAHDSEAPSDAAPIDAGAKDSAPPPDAAPTDSGAHDSAAPPDAAPPDATTADATPPADSAPPDAGTMDDATTPDAGSPSCASHGYAGTLVTFDLTSEPGSETSVPATTSATGVTGGPLSRAPTLTPVSGSGSINASGWSTGATADSSRYYTFTVTPATGCAVTLSSLSIDAHASTTGPSSADVATSDDAFTAHTTAFAATGTATVTVSSASSAGAIEVRVYGYDATGTSGTLRIEGSMSVSGTIE